MRETEIMKQKVSIQFPGKLPETVQAEVDMITEHILEAARSDRTRDRLRETIRGEVAVMFLARMRRYRLIGDITGAQYRRLVWGIISDLRIKYALPGLTAKEIASCEEWLERNLARSRRKYEKAAAAAAMTGGQ
jgi:hypothetical protein